MKLHRTKFTPAKRSICNAVRQPSQSVRMFGKALTMEKFAIPTSTGAQPPAMTMSIDGAW
jgi:hypothetical protein